MADVGAILAKVRALGADVVLDHGEMKIVGSVHLNGEQRAWLATNRKIIEAHLLSSGQGVDEVTPRPWGDYARLLYGACPDSVDPYDWSWFVTTAGKIIRGETEAETLQ